MSHLTPEELKWGDAWKIMLNSPTAVIEMERLCGIAVLSLTNLQEDEKLFACTYGSSSHLMGDLCFRLFNSTQTVAQWAVPKGSSLWLKRLCDSEAQMMRDPPHPDLERKVEQRSKECSGLAHRRQFTIPTLWRQLFI